MPTYDYKCLVCGDTFEHFQTMTEEHLNKCNKCEGELKRLIGAGLGPIFKGSGFYQTDYKNSSNNASNKSENKKSEKSDKKSGESKSSKAKKVPQSGT